MLFWSVFKNQKHAFLGIQRVVFKTQIKKKVCVCSLMYCTVKGSFLPIFTKNINIWAPWNFLKMKTLTSKIIPDLLLFELFCLTKKMSTFHPTV